MQSRGYENKTVSLSIGFLSMASVVIVLIVHMSVVLMKYVKQ